MRFTRGLPLLAGVLILASVPAAKAQTPPPDLASTSWRLVRIQSMDDQVVTPADRSTYTMAFGADGRVSFRVDCNRGSGAWRSAGAGQLAFGPLALTRAMCPPGSLHDRVVKDLAFVRSYLLKDGHLFLSLMADGGIYELEPLPKPIDCAKASGAVEKQICGGLVKVSGPVTYACTDAQGGKSEVIATFYATDPPSALVERGGRTVLAMQAPAASGAKYEGPNVIFWEHQGEAQVTWMQLALTCKPRK